MRYLQIETVADMWHLPIVALMFKKIQIKTKDAKPLVECLEPLTHATPTPGTMETTVSFTFGVCNFPGGPTSGS